MPKATIITIPGSPGELAKNRSRVAYRNIRGKCGVCGQMKGDPFVAVSKLPKKITHAISGQAFGASVSPTREPVAVGILAHWPSQWREKGRAPGRPRGDVDAPLSGVLDALAGVLYEDDAQVAVVVAANAKSGPGRERIEVSVRELSPQLLVALERELGLPFSSAPLVVEDADDGEAKRTSKGQQEELALAGDDGGKHHGTKNAKSAQVEKVLTATMVQAVDVAQYLYDAILSHTPDYLAKMKPSALEKRLTGWAKDIDRGLRIDGHEADSYRVCIDVAHRSTDRFWRSNLLSGKKLRKHYDRLRMHGLARRPPGHQAVQDPPDFGAIAEEMDRWETTR